jgi:acetoin utilization protein AcuB
MLVREKMIPNPITIPPETSVPDALQLMRDWKFHRLPIVDKHGQLVGIVSEKDLPNASPSAAHPPSVGGGSLRNPLVVGTVMTREVITVSEDAPIEEAAQIMADHQIGGLPVMRHNVLVGFITETDLLSLLLQLLGGRQSGIRMDVLISGAPGTVAKVACAVFSVDGKIIGLGLDETPLAEGGQRQLTVKVQGATRDRLVIAIRPIVQAILDVREL